MPSRSRIVVEPLGARELSGITGELISFPVVAHAGWLVRGKKRRLIGYGGLAWRYRDNDDPNKLWCELWFNIAEPKLMRTLTLVRWAQRMLRTARQMGDRVVFCVRVDGERPLSEKLLTIIGMTRAPDLTTFGDGVERTGEVWVWRG